VKPLPKKYKTLQEIGRLLNQYLRSSNTSVEIRSNELYDLISKDQNLKLEFPTNRYFNQFLRKQHQDGSLRLFIAYRVDDTNPDFYQWFFRTKHQASKTQAVGNLTYEGTFNYYKHSKTIVASDGSKLNSKQELDIYEQLKKSSHLTIKIEFPVRVNGETKFVDFIVENKVTGKCFYWEHFGMTNSEEYKNAMESKIEWYKNNGFKTVEEGGSLILSYFSNENNFYKDISKFIDIIKS
jgi:hypothetical protein